MTRKLTIETEDGLEHELPYKWEICDSCNGEGTSSAYLGAFTQSEWAEQDDEFKEDYIAGRYDRACEHCQNGKVKVVDRAKADPILLKAWDDMLQHDYECEAERRAEARMLGEY